MSQYDKGQVWVRTSEEMKQKARQLRKQMTPAEQKLWQRVRKRQVAGLKFRRQHPFGPYIFDFFCDELRLVIELDGSVHDKPSLRSYDNLRDEWCRACGLIVLRFANEQVFTDVELIVQAILNIQMVRTS
jgi:very-short-patch-repair endonuclease